MCVRWKKDRGSKAERMPGRLHFGSSMGPRKGLLHRTVGKPPSSRPFGQFVSDPAATWVLLQREQRSSWMVVALVTRVTSLSDIRRWVACLAQTSQPAGNATHTS